MKILQTHSGLLWFLSLEAGLLLLTAGIVGYNGLIFWLQLNAFGFVALGFLAFLKWLADKLD